MTFAFLLLFAGVSVWLKYGRPMGGVLLDFAKLVDDPEVVDDLRNRLAGRTFLRGEFRGRKVAILAQNGNRSRPEMLVVSMESRARTLRVTGPIVRGSWRCLRWRRSSSLR